MSLKIYRPAFRAPRLRMAGKNLYNSPPFQGGVREDSNSILLLREGGVPAGGGGSSGNGLPNVKGNREEGVVVNNKKLLKTFRKELRNHLTSAEAVLWRCLKNKQLDGRKFRRQHSIDNYILDFYCPSEHLGIELDGKIHDRPSQSEYDYERDIFLQYYGVKILRFGNNAIFNDLKIVIEKIRNEFKNLPPRPSGTPPSHGGENLYNSPP